MESAKASHRLLLVDDNRDNLALLRLFLENAQYGIDEAVNGNEAVERFAAATYSLVLMDLEMPLVDGYEATRRIRAADSTVRNPAIPIIAMTASAMQGDRERCLDCGMNDYLAKPVSFGALAEVLERWLPAVDEAALESAAPTTTT